MSAGQMTCCANLAQCLIESIFFTSLDEATAARVEQFDTISDAPERCSRFVEELHADPTSSYVVRAETAGHVYLLEFGRGSGRVGWRIESLMDCYDSSAKACSLDEVLESAQTLEVFEVFSYEPEEALARLEAASRLCFDQRRLIKSVQFSASEETWNFVLNLVRFLNLEQHKHGAVVWSKIIENLEAFLAITQGQS